MRYATLPGRFNEVRLYLLCALYFCLKNHCYSKEEIYNNNKTYNYA